MTSASVGPALASASARPRQREGVVSCALFEDVVLMAPASDVAVVLNTSSRAIWDLCDGDRSIVAILRELRSRYDAPAETLQDDLTATLSEFASAGLVDFHEATA